jgi:hypothetical protein
LTVTSPALIIRATCEREYSGASRIDTNTSSRMRSCSAPAVIVVGIITSVIYRRDPQITASRAGAAAVRSAVPERWPRREGSSRCWSRLSRRHRWSSDSLTPCQASNRTSIQPAPSSTARRLSSRRLVSCDLAPAMSFPPRRARRQPFFQGLSTTVAPFRPRDPSHRHANVKTNVEMSTSVQRACAAVATALLEAMR